MVTAGVSSLYAEMQNLEVFVHPDYHRRFRTMTPIEVFGLAQRVAAALIKTGIETVVVAESGASPLMRMVERLTAMRHRTIDFVYLKFPREPLADLSPVILHYLSNDERRRREAAIRKLGSLLPTAYDGPPILSQVLNLDLESSEVHARIREVLTGTAITQRLSRPFLYFDEYVDSGTTVRNALRYLPVFSDQPSMSLGAFSVNVPDPGQYPRIAFSLYNRSTRLASFEPGVYPFENRIDLIGYWYTIGPGICSKTAIGDLIEADTTTAGADQWIRQVRTVIDTAGWVPKIRSLIAIPAVADVVSADHLCRYAIARFESVYGLPETAEFLAQLFEMYAPAWSPLPDEYHISFVAAVSTLDAELTRIIESPDGLSYRSIRHQLISAAARCCHNRYSAWQSHINRLYHSL